MYGLSTMRIAKLVIQQTGTYGQQYRRAYSLNLNGALQNQLEEAVGTSTKLSPSAMVTGNEQLIVPSASPESAINIINGWETPRLKFFMRIEATDQMGTKLSSVLTGYTEYAELSMGNHFDPRMRFFVNNVINTKLVSYNNPLTGNTPRHSVAFAQQLVADADYGANGYLTNPVKNYAMTPTNLFNNMPNLDLIGAAQMGNDLSGMLIDTSGVVTDKAKKVNRSHGLGTQYVADVLNTYLGTKATLGDEGDYSQESFFETCATTAKNIDSGNDFFLNWLAQRNANSGWGYGAMNSFTMNDLMVFDPNVQSVTEVIPINNGLHSAGQTAEWGGSGAEAVFATTLVHGITALMNQFAFMSIGLKATNMASVMREHMVVFTGVNGLNNHLNQASELSAFRFRLETEVLGPLSFNNQMGYDIEVNADIGNETWVDIYLEGYGKFVFAVPSFCDAMLTPMVTMNRSAFDTMTMQMHQLGQGLSEVKAYNSTTPVQPGLNSFETGRRMYNL